MTTPKKSARIEVFRPGTFTPMKGGPVTFSADDLSKIAENYDALNHPVPIVVGHPKVDDPAYGWVKSFSYDGDNERLLADVEDIEPRFASAVGEGRYKKVSLAFFPPDASSNPIGGGWYPKHVGFLGGRAPAVPGLKPVSFSEDDGALVFEYGEQGFEDTAGLFRNIREWIIEKFSVEEADKVLPSYRLEWLDDTEVKPPKPASQFSDPADPEPKKQEKEPTVTGSIEFAEREKTLAAREKELDIRDRKSAHDANVAFADGLVSDNKLLPAKKDQLVALLDAAPGDAEISFADGDSGTTWSKAIRGFLSDLPEIVPFGETNVPGEQNATIAFASDGKDVDPDQLEIHNKALAYQAQHPGTEYFAAVKAVQ